MGTAVLRGNYPVGPGDVAERKLLLEKLLRQRGKGTSSPKFPLAELSQGRDPTYRADEGKLRNGSEEKQAQS